MSTTIDSLDIQISSSAGSSAANIEQLANALGKLKENGKLTTTVNNLTRLKTALDGLKSASSGLKNIESVGKVLSGLRDIGKLSGLTSAVNALKKIPAITASLNSATLTSFELKIRRLTSALAPLSVQLNAVGTAFSKRLLKAVPTAFNCTERGASAEVSRLIFSSKEVNVAELRDAVIAGIFFSAFTALVKPESFPISLRPDRTLPTLSMFFKPEDALFSPSNAVFNLVRLFTVVVSLPFSFSFPRAFASCSIFAAELPAEELI